MRESGLGMKKMPPFSFEEKVIKSWQGLRPKVEQFRGKKDAAGRNIYTEEELRRDQAKVRNKRTRIFVRGEFSGRGDDQLAEDFEYSLMESLHDYGWFDEEVSITPGSEFDDYFRGVDFVLAFREGGEQGKDKYFYLAVDATISENPDILLDKEKYIIRNVEQGRLTEVKYFINDDNPQIAGKFYMPHVVLGFGREKAEQFKSLLSKGRNLSSHDQKLLEGFRREILDEMASQLKKYIKRMESVIGKMPKDKIPERFKQAINSYQDILSQILKYQKRG